MNKLQALDYSAIILYMIIMSGIGIFMGRLVKNINDYFKGGSGVSWIAGGISNFMTKFSTVIFVAFGGIAYTDGLVAITVLWATIFPSLIAIFFFAKRWKRTGIMSPVEFLETRYNAPIRQIFSWSGVVFKLLDDMIKLYSIGLFVTAASGISFETAVIGCGVVVTLYTVIGGFWAVIVTDVVQFVILFFATLILVPLSYTAAGGIENMQAVIPQNMTWFNGKKGMPLWLITYYALLIIRYLGNWTFIQRFYSAKTEKDGQKLAALSAFFFFIFPVIFLFPPLAARVILPNLQNPEMAYVSLCLELLPEGIMGLMMAAMFSATMSVLSAEYNVTASVLTRDIYQRVFRPNASSKESLLVGRLMTLAVGAIVTIGALFVSGFGGAFEANKLLGGVFAVPMIVPVIFGVLMRKPQPWGALATLFLGTLLGFVMNANKAISWEVATLIEIAFCITIFTVSGLFPSKDSAYNQKVDTFFHKLTVPFVPEKETNVNDKFRDTIKLMYGIAFGLTGLMFIIMGFPSRNLISGKLALAAGTLCLVSASFLYFRKRNLQSK
ncbi:MULTISPECIES: sodium:solute symporter family protein [unclassified Arcicella]|uniref:sodium:solute symporter family protein n=1 Tax=unclassified Arcicella TaxID=2644986 RepID=UPI00285E3A03|nr:MULTISPECIES: sodium:solute symporter family protein [unclassified Arcicella]MDR6562279.1 SSS family transporter [Arcicella sp. BE51]MDR6812027.1 SSS family transporter [Arcicella sp. BE140]MDR6823338.1 SSS family transporter [Arcicella sp. BE139]